jgi:predicted helicase
MPDRSGERCSCRCPGAGRVSLLCFILCYGNSGFYEKYKKELNKQDIFYYVYGILHSKLYREKYKADLKKSLPRIPIVDDYEDFIKFSEAGKKLSDLHLNYEKVKPYKKCEIIKNKQGEI